MCTSTSITTWPCELILHGLNVESGITLIIDRIENMPIGSLSVISNKHAMHAGVSPKKDPMTVTLTADAHVRQTVPCMVSGYRDRVETPDTSGYSVGLGL